MAQKAEAEKARQDHRAILDPDIKPFSERAMRANNKTLEWAEEFEEQPIVAVAAVVTRSLGMITKSVERSRNIQGPIKRDLWAA